MLLASKFEEIYPPEVRDFCVYMDRAYKVPEIHNGRVMLRKLDWEMSVVFSHDFIAFSVGNMIARNGNSVYNFSLELSGEYRFLAIRRVCCCFCVVVSLKLSPERILDPIIIGALSWKSTPLTRAAMSTCARDLLDVLLSPQSPKEKAVRMKWSKNKRHMVSTLSGISLRMGGFPRGRRRCGI